MEITAFRSLVTAVLMLAGMALFKRKELRVKWKDLWCFAGTGILSVAFFNVCYFTCMNYATLSVAAILLYTAPSFVMVFSYFLFKEKIGGRKLIALALAFGPAAFCYVRCQCRRNKPFYVCSTYVYDHGCGLPSVYCRSSRHGERPRVDHRVHRAGHGVPCRFLLI